MTRTNTASHEPSSRFTQAGTEYEPLTAHYNRRKIDDRYEVVVRARVQETSVGATDPDQPSFAPWRWVVFDVKNRREEAVARVREIREGNA